eukprot:6464702-Amphidinium_carterae.2
MSCAGGIYKADQGTHSKVQETGKQPNGWPNKLLQCAVFAGVWDEERACVRCGAQKEDLEHILFRC